jgi:preprotein translocase subunit SecG
MYTLLVTLSLIIAIVLIIVVLLQSGKGGGLSGTFGGGGGGGVGNFGQVFGTRRTADFLSTATWWLGGSLLFLAIIINLFFLPGKATQQERESIIQSSQQNVPTQPALPSNPNAQGGEQQVPGQTQGQQQTQGQNQEPDLPPNMN